MLSGRKQYCGVSCASRAKAKKLHRMYDQRGANNPNYKGCRALTNYQRKLQQKARYPERVKARELAASALKGGRLVRKPCEVCESTDVQMHHDDYLRPLAVRWLCAQHHRLLHRTINKRAIDSCRGHCR